MLKYLIPNPLEFFSSILNVDSKWLSTFYIWITYHILNTFSSWSIGRFLLFLFLLAAFTFFITNTDSRKSANISPLSTSWRCLGSLLCVFMIRRANLLSDIHNMKVLSSVLGTFMKKIVRLRRYHECGVLNFQCAYQLISSSMIEAANLTDAYRK